MTVGPQEEGLQTQSEPQHLTVCRSRELCQLAVLSCGRAGSQCPS